MKLQAKDLMIGDWVKVKYTQKQVKVKEIKQSCIYTEGNGYEYDEIESIPLTTEILEKNRWIYEDSLWLHEDAITLQEGFDGTNLFFWFVAGSPFLPINYVHELQHALRFCGIDKEIEL